VPEATPSVFISSRLSPELQPLREWLKAILDQRRVKARYGDHTSGARSDGPVRASLEQVRGSDLFVLLVDQTMGPVTAEEWREAQRLGIPTLVYFSSATTEAAQQEIIDSVFPGGQIRESIYGSKSFSLSGTELGWANIFADIIIELEAIKAKEGRSERKIFDEVHEYCELTRRNPGTIEPHGGEGRFVADWGDGRELVSCHSRNPSHSQLEEIAGDAKARGLARFRIVSASEISTALRPFAEIRGGTVQTIGEFLCEILDIEAHWKELEALADTLALDDRFVEIGYQERVLDKSRTEVGIAEKPDVVAHADRWLENPYERQLAVLGDFGSGKSWFSMRVALNCLSRIRQAKPARFPVLVPLKHVPRDENNVFALGAHIQQILGIETFSSALLTALIESGRLLLILDGLDETGTNAVGSARDHEIERKRTLAVISELALPRSKTILTSRRAFFDNIGSEFEELYELGGVAADGALQAHRERSFEILYLADFSERQIEQKIERRFGAAGRKYIERVARLPNLGTLVRRPIVLDMVLGIMIGMGDGEDLTLLRLYELCAKRWLSSAAREGSPLGEEERIALMSELAWELYSESKAALDADDLSEIVQDIQDNIDASGDAAARSETLLVRDNAGRLSFAHRSFMEYFVALRLIEDASKRRWKGWAQTSLSDGTLDFLKSADLEADALIDALDKAKEVDGAHLAGNALTLLHAAKHDLRGIDLAGLTITGANLEGADLRGASLRGARLDGVKLGGADLSDVDCTGARLVNLNLGVKSHAKSIAVSPSAPVIAASNASNEIVLIPLCEDEPIVTLGQHEDSINRIRFDRRGETVGSVAFDGKLRLWDVERAQQAAAAIPLGTSTTYAVEMGLEPYGCVLTSGNDDMVHVWDRKTGREMMVIHEHTSTAYALASCNLEPAPPPAPPKWCFASASFDRTVKVYHLTDPNLEFGVREVQTLEHDDLVNGVAFQPPHGDLMASCDNSGTIYLWRQLRNGFSKRPTRIDAAHDSQIWSIQFSADGRFAASCSTDRTIKVWQCCDGGFEPVATLDGHTAAVWSIAFDASGDYLVSSSQDSTVRIWNWREEREVRKIVVGLQENAGLRCQGMKIAEATGLSRLQTDILQELGAQ